MSSRFSSGEPVGLQGRFNYPALSFLWFSTEKVQFFRNVESLLRLSTVVQTQTGSVVLAYSAMKCVLFFTTGGAALKAATAVKSWGEKKKS